MARAMSPLQIIEDGYMGNSVDSSVIDARDLQCVAVQAVYTGTPTGTFTMEGSVDYNTITGVGTWTTIDLGTLSISAAGDTLIDLTNTSIPFLRLHYAFGSGTGTLQAYASGKRFN